MMTHCEAAPFLTIFIIYRHVGLWQKTDQRLWEIFYREKENVLEWKEIKGPR
jgi:hypothetical protein